MSASPRTSSLHPAPPPDGVTLTREEAIALYRHAKDIALPNSDYALVLGAMRKLGAVT